MADEIANLFSHPRLSAPLAIVGLAGLSLPALFHVHPAWIGYSIFALAVLVLLGEASFQAWNKEQAHRAAAEFKLQDRNREVELGGLLGVFLATGNTLIELPIGTNVASQWEDRVSHLLGKAYGAAQIALFIQDGNQMADQNENFDVANTRRVLATRIARLAEVMSRSPLPPLRPSFDPDAEDWYRWDVNEQG